MRKLIIALLTLFLLSGCAVGSVGHLLSVASSALMTILPEPDEKKAP